jgi:recombinational DNA repair protein (RecF pathway)
MTSIPSGEADAVVELFTKDIGRISVHARGIRKEVSRLRYVVQPMSWILANIVRGASGWRLTTAAPTTHNAIATEELQSLARVSQMVRRLLPHESTSPQIFACLNTHHELLHHNASRRRDWEALTLARMFHQLGYWGIEIPSYVDHEISSAQKTMYINEINRILKTIHT